jgi:hypothetical protein
MFPVRAAPIRKRLLLLGLVLAAAALVAHSEANETNRSDSGSASAPEYAEPPNPDSGPNVDFAPPSSVKRVRPTTPASVARESEDYQPRSPTGALPFTRRDGAEFGIVLPSEFSGEDFRAPFMNGYGVASGDFNNDGWPDLVFGAKRGLYLYSNSEGRRFERVALELPGLAGLSTFVVALVDLDNDGWLDLCLSTFEHGNYCAMNHEGTFPERKFYRVPNGGTLLTQSAALGDIDRDGDLDLVLGNWLFGFGKSRPLPEDTLNWIVFNDGGGFPRDSAVPLDGMAGETLAVLVSDFDNDGALDVIVGNDFGEPDYYYRGDGRGGMRKLVRADGIIPVSTRTTMSIDTADIDNDLTPEIYLAQIAYKPTRAVPRFQVRAPKDYCRDLAKGEDKRACERNVEIKHAFRVRLDPIKETADDPAGGVERCEEVSLTSREEASACEANWRLQDAMRREDASLCDLISPEQRRTALVCRNSFRKGPPRDMKEWRQAIMQTKDRNILLVRSGEKGFVDRSEAMGLATTAWAWNAKFADLDNDQWQDLYVVNGTWLNTKGTTSNMFFANKTGRTFVHETEEFGLEDFLIVSAYTYLDFDKDGDLDIITNAVNGPARVYVNNETRNQSISFELRDARGNHFGIGSKIFVYYGEGGRRHQVRELKAGGGYLSFDAPIAHFGLGRYKQVERVEVIWSTGERSEIRGPLRSGAFHRILRR